jgi:Rho-binding antiterminator
MNAYSPVSCDFHDQVEALATLHKHCQIHYRNSTDDVVQTEGEIVDVYAAQGADFLKLKDGTEIRLDRITAIDNKPVAAIETE